MKLLVVTSDPTVILVVTDPDNGYMGRWGTLDCRDIFRPQWYRAVPVIMDVTDTTRKLYSSMRAE